MQVLKLNEPRYTWVGIYLVEGDELVLGPYLGKASPHTRIPIGQGICGAAAREAQTIIVPDVNADPRYLACSLETRSEIVVPIFVAGQVVGEIDIDSDLPDAFGPRDRELLERAAAMISEKLARTATAAIILRGDQVLICQRRADKALPLKWEFAGGKVEDGEQPADCLQRELREELDLDADIGPELCRSSYRYVGQDPVLLIFFQVTEFRGEPRNLIFAQIRWVPRRRLTEFDFLEADKEVVEQIARGGLV